MSKRFTKLIALFTATMAVFSASAQVLPVNRTPRYPSRNLPRQKTEKPTTNLLKTFPTLLAKTLPRGEKTPFFAASIPLQTATPKNLVSVNPSLTMWGNLLTDDLLGMYAFHPTANINFESLSSFYNGYFNAGSGLVDGILHGMFLDTSYASLGVIKLKYYAYDTKTWQLIDQPVEVNDLSLTATETAVDPVTGEIFGEFYAPDLNGHEWGVIDYTTLKRTTIAPAQHVYVALGIANDGFAYGVTKEGDFYQIDRTTGAETLKGSTGVVVSDNNGQYFTQSGEFDPRTNEFFWASTDRDGKFQLYTINLENGKVTPIGGYSTEASLMALTFPKTPTAPTAPAAASGLKADFKDGKLQGTFQFTAPDKTFDGSSLTGNVSYTLYANEKEITKGSIGAGKQATLDITVGEGLNNFVVLLANEAGTGPRSKITTYVGYDTPEAVRNVSFNLDETGNVSLTWDKPLQGTHKGYLGTLTYDVIRNVNGQSKTVAEGLSTTTFHEVIHKDSLSAYSYSVQAINRDKRSVKVTTNGEVFGNALNVPFFDDLSTANSADLYTVIDNNKDQSTWKWSAAKGGQYQYNFSKENTADDWLMTPPIQMKQGKTYKVSFKAAAGLKDFDERMEVLWGKGKTIDAMKGVLLPATDIKGADLRTYSGTLKPTADGDYCIGFHALSAPDRYMIVLDSISVEGAAEAKAPAAATQLTATPDATAALKATISFHAPTKAIDGSALTNITKMVVLNGKRTVKTIENPAPGTVLTVTDDAAASGENTYDIIAYNSFDFGEKASVTVYVGQDVPVMGKVKAKDQTTSVQLRWDVPAGVHNGVILPEQITYRIHNITEEGRVDEEIGSVKGKTEFTITGLNTNKGEQRYQRWAIIAENPSGLSNWVAGTVLVGTPYSIPYHNSFKNGTIENLFIGLERSDKNASWTVTNDVSSDNDFGSLLFRPSVPGVSTILCGKMNLQGATSPKLIFDYRGDGTPKEKVEIRFEKKDGEVTEPLWTNTVPSTNGTWKTQVVDIPTELIGEDYVLMRIIGKADVITDDPVFIDNINIADPLERDASIDLSVPEKVKKGQTAQLTVKVTNLGMEKMEHAKVTLTANDKVIMGLELAKTLSLLQDETFNVDYKTTSLEASDNLNIKATVDYEDDYDPENNTAEESMKLEKADVLTPQNLRVVDNSAATMKLSWDAPSSSTTDVNDNFEQYEAWGTSFGAWTTVDNDHGFAGNLVDGAQYNHQGEAFAFINWEPADIFEGADSNVLPHSGEKAAAAIYQVDNMGNDYIDADNWLISPQLSGKAQTIHFWVNNLPAQDGNYGTESFDVLTSMTNNEITAFKKVGDTHVQGSGKWTEVAVTVPEGTKFFAIHHITKKDNVFVFMVDDATFESGTGPILYNIYRDGTYVGKTYTTLSNEIANDGQTHQYSVTAVYADGSESEPVMLTVTTGIQNVDGTSPVTYDVYTLDGKQVLKAARSLQKLAKGIYVINGKKTIIK